MYHLVLHGVTLVTSVTFVTHFSSVTSVTCSIRKFHQSKYISTQPWDGYEYILRYVDHFSGFSHVAPLKSMRSQPIGMKLLEILSCSIIPEILQSDNGSEFLGDCIAILKKYYPGINIVKGRPRHPQSQGKIERGHAAFKKCITKMDGTYRG